MTIYTRRGDKGETGHLGRGRVSKDSRIMDAIGSVDELNSFIGFSIASTRVQEVRKTLHSIQRDLFTIGSDLASFESRGRSGQNSPRVTDSMVESLEKSIDTISEQLAPQKRFILPTGTPGAATIHVARAVARRTERRVVAAREEIDVSDHILAYLNRLSDLLFVLARLENRRSGVPEEEWKRGWRSS